ncbi:MAG: BspA family leucine-rich repeat surface protein, partial [Actinobacteria bacterium]|nr:BspA family leucine-rich repeat surface protein [Actinomycetota bacterium]
MPKNLPIRRRAIALAAVLLAAALSPVVTAPVARAAACASTPLNLTWDSSKTTGLIVDLHIRTSGATVTWGDGTSTAITTLPSAPTSHTYAASGTYTISVCGVISFGKFIRTWTNNRGASGFTAVTSFASTLTDLGGAFVDWANLTDVPAAIPAGVTTLAAAFYGASKFNDADVSTWSTANVTSLAQTFFGASLFNRPLNSWNTVKVTSLAATFFNAVVFNQPLHLWNTALVTDMSQTFQGAAVFDQNLGAWNTAKVTKLAQTFAGALVFNNGGYDTIKNWNLAANTSLNSTFWKAMKFNQPIGSWNTALVTTTDGAFQMAEVFNQDLGAWNTSKVSRWGYMFSGAKLFNNGGSPSINNWNTTAGTDFTGLFKDAPVFNQPIGNWSMSTATTLSGLFWDASKFDQDISNWNMAGAVSMATGYNVTNNVMSVANYDKLLKAWSGKALKSAVPFGWGLHKYSCDAEPARIKLASAPISWVMTDGGLAETAPSISTIVPGNGSLAVYVTAPSCMSSQRTSYEYSTDGGATWTTVSPASLASPITISGLDNGTTYSIKVRPAGGTIGVLPATAKASTAMSGTPVFDGAGVTAKNETSVYGASVPTVGYTTTLATGDWVDTVSCGAYTNNTYATAVTSSTKPGTYVAHCSGSTTSGLESDVKYTDGVYTVTKAPLSITAKSFTKTYGDVVTPDGNDDFTESGLV